MIQEEIEEREFKEVRNEQKTKAALACVKILKWFTAMEQETILEVIKDELASK